MKKISTIDESVNTARERSSLAERRNAEIKLSLSTVVNNSANTQTAIVSSPNRAGSNQTQESSGSSSINLLSKVKKILSSQKYENLKLKMRGSSPQNATRKKANMQKEHREMKRITFGYELIIDLYDCDKGVISSKSKLKEYVDKLCKLIKMKKFGKALIPYFGTNAAYTKGYSLVQLIETSSITGHFSDLWGTAYINIFSCKPYNQKLAADFTRKFFGAKKANKRFLVR